MTYRPDNHLRRELMAGDRLLSTAEVAALFRVARTTVTRWVQSGRIPNRSGGQPGALQVGRDWRIYESVVRGLLEGSMTLREVDGDGDDEDEG